MSLRRSGAYHSRQSHKPIFIKFLTFVAGISILIGVFGPFNDSKKTEPAGLITTAINLPGHKTQTPLQPIALTPKSIDNVPLSAPQKTHRSAAIKTTNVTETPTSLATNPLVEITTISASHESSASATHMNRYMDEWVVQKGDTMSSIFSHYNIHSELHPLMQLTETKKTLRNIKPGESIKFDIDSGGLRLLTYDLEVTKQLVVEKNDGKFSALIKERETNVNEVHAQGVIEDSLFASASNAGINDNLIMQLAEIFGYDIDFALDIRSGDSYKLIYEDIYLEGEKIDGGKILAAEFTNQAKTFQAVRYTNPAGETEYFSPDGRNMKKTFLRTPVNFTRISSRFNPRRKHPILHTIRAHKGVDYAAPTGTPIKAAGNGKIVHRGTKGGYGKTVIIQHGNKYSTLYAHMNNYRKGQRVGSAVKQGDVIGYVGRTGSATGPHLHYEFHVYGKHKNPLKVTLPKADPLPSHLIDDFRAKSDSYLSWLSSLSRVASADTER